MTPTILSLYFKDLIFFEDLREILRPFHLSFLGVYKIFRGRKRMWRGYLLDQEREDPKRKWVPHEIRVEYLDPRGFTLEKLCKVAEIPYPEEEEDIIEEESEMKEKIRISIQPKYCHQILKGEKRIEFRKRRIHLPIEKIYLYETKPKGRVVGEATVKDRISSPKEDLWEEIKQDKPGITKEEYDHYFLDNKIAHAILLDNVTSYQEPMPLTDFGLLKAPQSFCYLYDILEEKEKKRKEVIDTNAIQETEETEEKDSAISQT